MFRSISEDEYDDEEMPIRYRPRTGSLSEHEDLMALKAQAEAVVDFETKAGLGSLSADEAGYEVIYNCLILSFTRLKIASESFNRPL
jgi:hypothetical protein